MSFTTWQLNGFHLANYEVFHRVNQSAQNCAVFSSKANRLYHNCFQKIKQEVNIWLDELL